VHQATHGFELAFAFVLQDVLEVVFEVGKVGLACVLHAQNRILDVF
jgi:hypothetical protein